MRLLSTLILLVLGGTAFAQTGEQDPQPELIQFSGIIVDDSLGAIPYAYVYEKSSRKGTVSDYYGYFSFVAEKGDTIMFESISYKDAYLVIPDTLSSFRYSIIQMLESDARELDPANVYPWPSKEQFIDAFVNLEMANNSYDLAAKNLKRQELAAQARGVSNDGYLSHKDAMREQQQKIYYAGQAPPNNLLNPIAWAQFVKAWKNGDLKRQ